jgi:hypothetical protein
MAETNPFVRGARDRSKLLHVGVDGIVTLERHGARLRLACTELSLSGMVVHAPEPWPPGTEVALELLEVEGATFDLEGFATVSHAGDAPDGDGSRLTTLEYVDFDAVARSCIHAAFSFVVEQHYRDARPVMRFHWAFRDVAQLIKVCRTLLDEVELKDAWTDAGPSELARSYLAGKVHGAPGQRTMLDVVWKLWCGSLDIPDPPAELPQHARGALVALKKAIPRGPAGIDQWLSVERC